jgi:DmsE family decaheme c-type cytochrome
MERKSRISAPRLTRIVPLVLLVAACATGAIREKILSLPSIEGATPVGQSACLECHEDAAKQMAGNVHGRLAEFEYTGGNQGCESCHGSGSLHVSTEGDAGKIIKFGELLPEQSAAVCAKCHTSGKLMDWTHSQHALSDVACSDCHSIHSADKFALKKQEPELCYGCHQEQMAKANFPSHHPIKEGKMNCSSCHNPHGELNTEERANDLCLGCHTRYQGPFVFGHVPVEDDCTICHDPHGSVANNMLVQNEPFLCLQCHEGHFHILRESNYTVPNPATGQTPTTPAQQAVADVVNVHGKEGFQTSFATKCTTCHKVVHGSDYPSQPLSGGGLTR